jgi:hypothetical protein
MHPKHNYFLDDAALIQEMNDGYFFKPVDLPGTILVGYTINDFIHCKYFVD